MKINQIYDLTRPLFHNCPGWPGFMLTETELVMCQPQDQCQVERVNALTHVATHADSPVHWIENGDKMEDVSIDTWIGEGVVLDLTGREPKSAITYDDLEQAGKHVKEGDIIALWTGWQKYYGYNAMYLKDWPSIDESGANWIVEHGVKCAGCDTLGIERFGFPEGSALVHYKLLGEGVCILEELNLEEIGPMGDKRWLFCWQPVLLKGAGGSFARAVAMDVE